MGKSGRRTMWHADCADAFLLATNLYRQQRFLRERDGPLCQWPGCDQPGHEVDHKIPLWSVDQSLPIDQLRWFYGPENQWRLCGPHHKIKTAREAAQRAAERRAEAAQAILPLGESTP
jgi:5-methylcytosine-specific restriction endonuclease McrA